MRAAQTADLLLDAAGLDLPVHLDERLRERELGILDLLTRRGVEARYPDEARRKQRLGKFYHRPPGGESWVDVALRIRSLRDSLGREHLDERVLMVCHEVVVVIWRYLIEDLDEQAALGVEPRPSARQLRTDDLRDRNRHRLTLELDGWTAPLEMEEVPVTEEHDARVKPR